MDNRAISIGLAASLAIYLITRPLLKWHEMLLDDISSEAVALILDSVSRPISIASWLVGGAVIGQLCKCSPIKNGAIAGAIYGFALSIVGIALVSSQTHDMSAKYLQLIRALIVIGTYSFLFVLSSSLGSVLKRQRSGI